MKKKRITSSWGVFTLGWIICWIVLLLLSLSGCTLHFKGENIELETKPPAATIGNTQTVETDYDLVAIGLLKNARR